MEKKTANRHLHNKEQKQKEQNKDCSGNNAQPPSEFDKVEAIPLLTEKQIKLKPSAAEDVGVGDINDPMLGTRVGADDGRVVFMRFTSSLGNITIWRVASEQFMFSIGERGNERYITAYLYNGKRYAVWKTGGDPLAVTESNMQNDDRVWQIFHKFSKYFIRLEMMKQYYLHSVNGQLKILDVGDPDNTRLVTPLEISLVS